MKKSSNFWPYGIVAAFLIFCSFMIGFAVYSSQHKTELVADDYYDQEIQYQQVIDGKKRLSTLSRPVKVTASAEQILIEIPDELMQADSGHIRFYRPSNENWDFRAEWVVFQAGSYSLPASDFVSGPYQLVMQAYKDGDLYFHEQRITIE